MLFVPVGAAAVQCVLWINLLAAEGGTSLFHDRNHIGVPDSGRCGSKPDLVAALMSDDPEAVVLDLVDPAVADPHLVGEHGKSGADEAGRL